MTIDIELIGIVIAVLSPVYAALWYLIILGTNNKSNILEMKTDLTELKVRFDNCTYCKKGVHDNR